jgi:hypothetical protein
LLAGWLSVGSDAGVTMMSTGTGGNSSEKKVRGSWKGLRFSKLLVVVQAYMNATASLKKARRREAQKELSNMALQPFDGLTCFDKEEREALRPELENHITSLLTLLPAAFWIFVAAYIFGFLGFAFGVALTVTWWADSPALFGLVSLTSLLLFVALFAAAARHLLGRRADSYALLRLVATISALEEAADAWQSLAFRRRQIRALSSLAQTFEHTIPRALASRSALVDADAHAVWARKAAHVRSLTLWLAMPYSDTRETLLSELAHILRCGVPGDWAALPEADAPTPKASRRAAIRRTAGTGVVALLPAAALYAAQTLTPDVLEGFEALWIGVGMWALFGLLNAAAPEMTRGVVALAKDATGSFYKP